MIWIAAGLIAAIYTRYDGWIIALGDMPFLLPQTIKTIAARIAQAGCIAIPAYHGTPHGTAADLRFFFAELNAEMGSVRRVGLVGAGRNGRGQTIGLGRACPRCTCMLNTPTSTGRPDSLNSASGRRP